MKQRYALLALAALAVGCASGPEQQIVGNWTADANSVKLPSGLPKEMEAKAKETLGAFNIKFSADKTFTMTGGGQSGTGKWALVENTVELSPNEGGDQQKLKLQLSEDKSKMTFNFPIPIGEMTIDLKKTG